MLRKTKWIVVLVAISFAILQTLQPFIHAHFDEVDTDHHSGFHTVDDHESATSHNHTKSSEAYEDHSSHKVTIASGINSDLKTPFLVDVLIGLTFSLYLILITSFKNRLNPASLPIFKETSSRRRPGNRAPPKY